jgi:5'(3')-deoxyribonucleotidase
MNKVILTDCDGVLLNWESQFHKWMNDRGYNQTKSGFYEIHDVYDMAEDRAIRYIEEFNTSSYVIDLPPLKNSVEGLKRLTENGYKFVVITSIGDNPYTKKLRTINLETLFGKDTFIDIICLSEKISKKSELEKYKDSGLYWIEDLPKNASLGADLGLKPILLTHHYNQYDCSDHRLIRTNDWNEICNIII